MRNTIEKNRKFTYLCGITDEVEKLKPITPELILNDLLRVYGSIVPFKTFLHEMFLLCVGSQFLDTELEQRELFVANYRYLYQFLCEVEVLSLTQKEE